MFDSGTLILVVDDMKTMRKFVIKALQKLGFSNFLEAEDGTQAWEALTSNPSIGLVISDWNMPNCTGIDLLKRVRGDKRYQKFPFLLVTAESEKHQVVEALKSGVSGYVVKPFTPEAILAQLDVAYKKLQG